MNRRDFVKTSSLITLPLLLKSCQWTNGESSYPVQVHSDAKTGHLLFESKTFPETMADTVEVLIVGGGIAGMAAACELKEKDFLLCELSGQLGGTSSAYLSGNLTFAQGAHYDMGYPDYYGKEVLKLLEGLNIIQPQPWKNTWGFVDQQHLIMHRRKNQCFDRGEFRKEVISDTPLKKPFFELMNKYQGQMPLPTRLIHEKHHELNQLSFVDFLQNELDVNDDLIRSVSYHMKDDYGADAYQVSALAGIHYFACRPYTKDIVELFSPPEGNHYFIRKMADYVGPERLKTTHLVKSIEEVLNGFSVKIIDIATKTIKVIKTGKIIYAGQKHALKYIFPQDYSLFQDVSYAPWMVVNVVLNGFNDSMGYWQNEMLTEDDTFLGFVDSSTQHTASGDHRILTAYYCLPPTSREDLINAEVNKSQIAQMTVKHLSGYFEKDLSNQVERIDIKVMGHAMPIPGKNHLFKDKNLHRSNKNIAYAGVDNGRLPLLFEAMDSGIIAAGLVSSE
ncbi:FAD-binding protein [Fulvivirga sp. M361]|uniref:NAD(P)-binding protein n=1 Tax=Fulvivirga sp. M361 TaxID=2594266 RepID=UPI00117A3A37|nr:NAD(P)-binding protein [Fulvivirga sp. M361]TRX50642.1 FAD-binding protein [Fulvivirga sp. M361]